MAKVSEPLVIWRVRTTTNQMSEPLVIWRVRTTTYPDTSFTLLVCTTIYMEIRLFMGGHYMYMWLVPFLVFFFSNFVVGWHYIYTESEMHVQHSFQKQKKKEKIIYTL